MSFFKALGTIAFEASFMRERLFYGHLYQDPETKELIRDETDRTSLCLAEWILFVPEVFKDKATLTMIQACQSFKSEKATQETILRAIHEFQRRVHCAIECEELTRFGWI